MKSTEPSLPRRAMQQDVTRARFKRIHSPVLFARGKELMLWKKIEEKDLESQGWKYILTHRNGLKVFKKKFKKKFKIIFWDSKTQTVIHESLKKQVISVPF